MKTVLYEDQVENFLPLVHLYPQYRLRIGSRTVAEHLMMVSESKQIEYVCREYFHHKQISAQGPKIYLSARLVLSEKLPRVTHNAKFVIGNTIVGFVKHKPPYPVTLDEITEALKHIKDTLRVQGVVLEHMWDIIAHNSGLITSQFARLRAGRVPAQVYIIGDRRNVRVARSARVYRHVAIDVTDGPVIIDERAQIRPFSSIIGPAYIGQDTVIDRAKIIKSSIGPLCRVGGEVEACVFQGYANKYHEGFIGHSFVGEWVNLGALTTNSDLKNNYGPVRLDIAGKTVTTGMTKLGCFIGDHTKTGIGTLIPTGAIIGCFVNFFGGGMMPRNVPCFRWISSREDTDYDLDRAIGTARLVMNRRGLTMSSEQEAAIRYIHQCQMSS